MVTSPATFFRFLAEHVDLVMALFDLGVADEATLLALIERHRSDSQASAEHIRRQLQDLRLLEPSPEADTVFEVTPQLGELLSWLTHRQRMSSAEILRGYLDELRAIGRELQRAVGDGDASVAALALRDAKGTIERVRSLSEGNRETIISEAQKLRSAGPGVSAVERYQEVRRLWERYLQPLRQLVEVDGEMDQRLDDLHHLLDEGERTFASHGRLQRAFVRMTAGLARMRRAALADHHAAMREVAPLYDRLRRDSRWLVGAARALMTIRDRGIDALDIDRRLSLVGWRSMRLLSDEKLRARLAVLVGYEPDAPVVLGSPLPPPPPTLISRDDLRRALSDSVPVADVLAFVIETWPDYPVGAYLRAFGHICSGEIGKVYLAEGATLRRYSLSEAKLEAWPLALSGLHS